MGKFNFNDSPAKKVAEEIRDTHDAEKSLQPTPATTPQPEAKAVGEGLKSKKTENGIVCNVPMDDYMQLTLMKMQTGRTLKELALQAIHEFVERNKITGQ